MGRIKVRSGDEVNAVLAGDEVNAVLDHQTAVMEENTSGARPSAVLDSVVRALE